MGKELRVRSDQAYDIAHRLAEARDESVDAVVEVALRDLAARRGISAGADEDVFSEAAIARRRARREAIVAENRRHLRERPPVDDSDLYDEYGLPK